MSDVPQTDVSRPSALPTAKLLQRQSQPTIDQKSNEYLDAIEEEWNKRVDVEIETLVDGMADIVGLASVRPYVSPMLTVADLACRGSVWTWGVGCGTRVGQIGDKDKFRIAQEAFQAQCRAESMVRPFIVIPSYVALISHTSSHVYVCPLHIPPCPPRTAFSRFAGVQPPRRRPQSHLNPRARPQIRAANSLMSTIHSMKLLLLLSDESQIAKRRDAELRGVQAEKADAQRRVAALLDELLLSSKGDGARDDSMDTS